MKIFSRNGPARWYEPLAVYVVVLAAWHLVRSLVNLFSMKGSILMKLVVMAGLLVLAGLAYFLLRGDRRKDDVNRISETWKNARERASRNKAACA